MPMVLQTLTQGVRRANSENMPPPSSLKGVTTKRNRLLTAIHNDSRRKFVTPSSSTQLSKQRVESAKKRKALKKVKNLEIQVNAVKPSTATLDVTMVETNSSSKIPLPNLPRCLPKPPVPPIPQSALSGEALEYGAEWYRNETADVMGACLLDIVGRTTPHCPSFIRTPSGHSKVEASLSNFTTQDLPHLPTHVVAVWGARAPEAGPSEPTPVQLYPAHGDVLRTHYAQLPTLPSQIPVNPPTSDKPLPIHLTLATQTLCLPSPQHYAPLHRYLYHHNTTQLLRELLIVQLPAGYEDNQAQIPAFGCSMARHFDRDELMRRALNIHGVYRNACALGTHDEGDGLWDTIDLAWETIRYAFGFWNLNAQPIDNPPPSTS